MSKYHENVTDQKKYWLMSQRKIISNGDTPENNELSSKLNGNLIYTYFKMLY
jgi:hypothetical protein